jgi:hypothetical protein
MTLNLSKTYILLIITLLTISSCGDSSKEPVRYRNAQQPRGGAPYYQQQQNPYYYQAPPTVSPGYGGGYGYPPASRSYSNPYSFPPRNQYPYYDSDQQYVPPSYYGTTDNSTPDGGFEKF